MTKEIKEFNEKFESFQREVLVDITMLKVKAAIWGAVAGAGLTALWTFVVKGGAN